MKLECILPGADFDGSGLVDLRDFAALQNCFTGPAPTVCDSACYPLDLDADDDIDADDYAEFRVAMP